MKLSVKVKDSQLTKLIRQGISVGFKRGKPASAPWSDAEKRDAAEHALKKLVEFITEGVKKP